MTVAYDHITWVITQNLSDELDAIYTYINIERYGQ